jgi:hypothetical protein
MVRLYTSTFLIGQEHTCGNSLLRFLRLQVAHIPYSASWTQLSSFPMDSDSSKAGVNWNRNDRSTTTSTTAPHHQKVSSNRSSKHMQCKYGLHNNMTADRIPHSPECLTAKPIWCGSFYEAVSTLDYIASNNWYDDWQVMSWEAFGGNRSWPDHGTVLSHFWKDWGKWRKINKGNRWPDRDSYQAYTKYKFRALLFHQTFQFDTQ